jgi:hypothetical protein
MEPASCPATNWLPSRNWFSVLPNPIARRTFASSVKLAPKAISTPVVWLLFSKRSTSGRPVSLRQRILRKASRVCRASCTAPLVLEHRDFEFDVCVIHGGLVRYCDPCGFATVWKFTSTAPAPRPQLVASAQEPEPVATAVAVLDPPPPPMSSAEAEPPQPAPLSFETLADFIPPPDANRRLHRRAKVNYYACVRTEAFGDDIVPCIDMSRGGLSFKTKHPYPLSSLVNIALSFARKAPQAPPSLFPLASPTSIPFRTQNSFAAASPSCRCADAVRSASSRQLAVSKARLPVSLEISFWSEVF